MDCLDRMLKQFTKARAKNRLIYAVEESRTCLWFMHEEKQEDCFISNLISPEVDIQGAFLSGKIVIPTFLIVFEKTPIFY